MNILYIQKVKVKVAQSCPTLCNPVDYIFHGILQARILEWVAIPFSGGSSQPRDWTQVSCIAGGFFTSWVTREDQEYWSGQPIPSPGDLPNPGMFSYILICLVTFCYWKKLVSHSDNFYFFIIVFCTLCILFYFILFHFFFNL